MKSLSTLKPLWMCWPLLLMPMAQGSYGLCSNNEKGRKNIIWGKRGDVGQGRLLNESHMLHSWHSHSYKHLLHPCPCCQCHLERGTMGIVRRTFWSAQGKLRTGSSCSSSTNSLEVCVLWEQHGLANPPRVSVDEPFLGWMSVEIGAWPYWCIWSPPPVADKTLGFTWTWPFPGRP